MGDEKTSGWRTRTADTQRHTSKETKLPEVETQRNKRERRAAAMQGEREGSGRAGGVAGGPGGGGGAPGSRMSTDADAA